MPAQRLVEEPQRQSVAVPMPVLMLCSRLRQLASQSAVVPWWWRAFSHVCRRRPQVFPPMPLARCYRSRRLRRRRCFPTTQSNSPAQTPGRKTRRVKSCRLRGLGAVPPAKMSVRGWGPRTRSSLPNRSRAADPAWARPAALQFPYTSQFGSTAVLRPRHIEALERQLQP